MKLTLHKTLAVFLLIAVWAAGCIREDVMLPPVLNPLDNSSVTSGTLLTLKGNYLDRSAVIFLNDTARGLEGEPTLTEIKFFLPVVKATMQSQIYVTTEFGSSERLAITLLPPVPAIKKVIPARGPADKAIKIVGSYFAEVTSVQFKSASQDTWIDATPQKAGDTLKVIVPKGLDRDAADIRVKSSSGESDPPTSFMVLVPPEIESLSTEKAGPNEVLTVVGKDFDYLLGVSFGKFSADIISHTSTAITVRIPSEAVTDDLSVETEGGIKVYAKKFVVLPKPVITGFDKESGKEGTELTVSGLNLGDVSALRFGDTPAKIEDQNEGAIKTKVPAGAQSGKVYVLGPAGLGESPEDFIIEGTPVISSFEPATGSKETVITLTGFNLETITSAKIGLYDLQIDETSKSPTKLRVKVLEGSVTGKIAIMNSSGGKYETSKDFTVIGSPKVNTISPAAGPHGTVVTISGENFPENPVVKFFGGAIATVIRSTSKEIVCQVPVSAEPGAINVNGAVGPEFTVHIKPVITKIEPMKGAINKDIVITGTGLKNASVRFFNNVPAEVTVNDKNMLTVRVPAGAATGKITVIGLGGAATTSTNDFEIISPATIKSFTPTTGVAGTIVTVLGTNLDHNPTVYFFNQVAATVSSKATDRLMVVVPPGASTGKISVRTDASNTPVQSQSIFSVIERPKITSIVPNSGTIKERIVIGGTDFRNIVSVSIDGVLTTTFIDTATNRITLRIPSTVNGTTNRTVNISIRTKADISLNFPFKLLGTPTITKVSPDNNPKNWAFLIEGTNLESVQRVSIGGLTPDVGTNGILLKGYNYITTKVPKDIQPADNYQLLLHYTSEGEAIPHPYKVLPAPPPGVFPPPNIILPPPIPSSYVQTDLSDYWINEYYAPTGSEPTLSCYQLRAAFSGQPSGAFCFIGKFYAVNRGGTWIQEDVVQGVGSWNLGKVTLKYPDDTLTGQVYQAEAVPPKKEPLRLVLTNEDGRQIILVQDESKNCISAGGGVVGICN